jgi:hypothetical protein
MAVANVPNRQDHKLDRSPTLRDGLDWLDQARDRRR